MPRSDLRLGRLVAVLALVLAAAAGCAKVPAGVDKDLVDEWAMPAEAKVPEPKAGDCWTTRVPSVSGLLAVPGEATQTPCDLSHVAETVHVGHLTGALAAADRAPSAEGLADAYAACDAEVTTFLGASWQEGRLQMLVNPPRSSQWEGGARFYRCDVVALRSERGMLDPRTTSLRGTLRAGGEMLLGCGSKVGTGDTWTDVDQLACTTPHDVEFVGVVPSASGTYPPDEKARTVAWGTACLNRIRSFTGMPDSALAKAKASYGYWQLATGEDQWTAGLHGARCYVLLPKKITRSLKGAGNITI